MEEKNWFVFSEERCYSFLQNVSVEVHGLEGSQEEVDTKIFLHLQHASNNIFNKFVVHTPDTDVIILCLGHLNSINDDVYIKIGVKTRVINLQKIKEMFLFIAD